MRILNAVFAAVALAASLTACANSDSGDKGRSAPASTETRIDKAYEGCQDPQVPSKTNNHIRVADEGRSLIIDGLQAGGYADLACILIGLNTSEAVVTEMDNTTAMMGTQEADSDGLHYRWSYHPDNGLDLIITEN